MVGKETENERLILEAAEAEFLEKGYASSRTTEIAKRAGLTHAMLHYYFRTKENLFEVVFQKKAKLMSGIILFSLEEDLPFLEKIKKGIEQHFDLIAANERLPGFILAEIRYDENLRKVFLNAIREKAKILLKKLELEIKAEVNKGTIQYIKPYDLLYCIISLNAFVFISGPMMRGVMGLDEQQYQEYLKHRKQMNVDIVLSQLKI